AAVERGIANADNSVLGGDTEGDEVAGRAGHEDFRGNDFHGVSFRWAGFRGAGVWAERVWLRVCLVASVVMASSLTLVAEVGPPLAEGERRGLGTAVTGEGTLLVPVHAHDAVGGLEVGEVPHMFAHEGLHAIVHPVE